MAAAECIPVNIPNAEVEEIKKLNGSGDLDEADGCLKNGKTLESAAEEVAPETTTDNSNTESTEQSEKTETPGNTGDEEVCEEEPNVGSEEIGEYDERINGHKKEDEEDSVDDEAGDSNDAEDGCDEAEDGIATKRPAEDEECPDEPNKKFCTETEEAQATSE